MKQGDKLNNYREQIKKSSLLINWDSVSDKWLEMMN